MAASLRQRVYDALVLVQGGLAELWLQQHVSSSACRARAGHGESGSRREYGKGSGRESGAVDMALRGRASFAIVSRSSSVGH